MQLITLQGPQQKPITNLWPLLAAIFVVTDHSKSPIGKRLGYGAEASVREVTVGHRKMAVKCPLPGKELRVSKEWTDVLSRLGLSNDKVVELESHGVRTRGLLMNRATTDLHQKFDSARKLSSFFKPDRPLHRSDKMNILYRVLFKLRDLQICQISHGDLKLRNVLCTDMTYSNREHDLDLTICDFSCSQWFGTVSKFGGTAEYIMPRRYNKTRHHASVDDDLYAFSVMLMSVFLGNFVPFVSRSQSAEEVSEAWRSKLDRADRTRLRSFQYELVELHRRWFTNDDEFVTWIDYANWFQRHCDLASKSAEVTGELTYPIGTFLETFHDGFCSSDPNSAFVVSSENHPKFVKSNSLAQPLVDLYRLYANAKLFKRSLDFEKLTVVMDPITNITRIRRLSPDFPSKKWDILTTAKLKKKFRNRKVAKLDTDGLLMHLVALVLAFGSEVLGRMDELMDSIAAGETEKFLEKHLKATSPQVKLWAHIAERLATGMDCQSMESFYLQPRTM